MTLYTLLADWWDSHVSAGFSHVTWNQSSFAREVCIQGVREMKVNYLGHHFLKEDCHFSFSLKTVIQFSWWKTLRARVCAWVRAYMRVFVHDYICMLVSCASLCVCACNVRLVLCYKPVRTSRGDKLLSELGTSNNCYITRRFVKTKLRIMSERQLLLFYKFEIVLGRRKWRQSFMLPYFCFPVCDYKRKKVKSVCPCVRLSVFLY